MNFKDNLKTIRKENNLSQEELAEKLRVSRQAVSKWEQGLAYPEMDKVLQICKLFNINMDDLLNHDIKKEAKEKQSKTSINKYIEDFLAFVTKSIDMFTNMNFKTKVKCIFEQMIIAIVEFIILLIAYNLLSSIFSKIVYALPNHYIFSNMALSLFDAAYMIFALVVAVVLLIHIFKVRYLDYYEDIKTEEEKVEEVKETKEKKKDNLEKKESRIIIRNPEHSDYKFISGILKVIMFGIKFIVLMITIPLIISLISLVVAAVLSFMIAKTGFFFIGILLSLIAAILLNVIVVIVLLNFILNRKNDSRKMLITFIASLLLLGVGIGLGAVGFTEFKYIDDVNNKVFKTTEFNVNMNNGSLIDDLYMTEAEFIEEDREDIKIIVKHTEYFKFDLRESDNHHILIQNICIFDDPFDLVREQLKNLNKKEIINYERYRVYVYASKNNIEVLQANKQKYLEELRKNDEQRIYNEIYELQRRVSELEGELEDKQRIIDSYEDRDSF